MTKQMRAQHNLGFRGKFSVWMIGLAMQASAWIVLAGFLIPASIQTGLASSGVIPAAVSSLNAYVEGEGTLVRWKTSFEAGVMNFDLYRSAGTGSWSKVNAEMIVAVNSLAGGDYEIFDAGLSPGKSSAYKLVGFDQRNREFNLGSFSVCPSEPTPRIQAAKQTSLYILANPEAGPTPARLAVADLNETNFVKITTTNAGLQTLTASRLATLLGETLTNVQSAIAQRQFRLTNRGQSVGYFSTGDGSALLFYASTYKDNYTDRNVFFLTAGGSSALTEIDGQSPPANVNPAYYPAVLNQERDLLDVTTLPINPDEDIWMWTRFVAGTVLDNATYRPVLDRVASSTNVPALLSFDFWGLNAVAHRIEIKVNGQVITNADWFSIAPFSIAMSVPSTLLTNGSNSIILKSLVVVPSPAARSQSYLNRFSITYPRQFFAQSGVATFSANSNSVISAAGFANSSITVLDFSNWSQPVVVTNLNIAQVAATNYQASFVPSALDAHYIAFQSGAGTPVDSVSLAVVSGLSHAANAANYVLITPESLMTAATNLADYRQQKGWQPLIARLDPIYNEFSHGFPTPHALHSLLTTAFTNWTLPPKHVVLIGDGTYDYRGIKTNIDNLTPPRLINTPYGIFASDSAFADVTGDGLPDVSVGRLTGNNATEVTQVINKVKAYEAGPISGQARALLLADAPDEAAGDFDADMRNLGGILSNKFQTTILSRTNFASDALMTAAVTNTWNLGVELVSYAGHGAVDRFGNGGYLTSANSTNLNSSRLPVVVATTCVAGNYSVPATDCLGEFLLRKDSSGAIAAIAPTGLSVNFEASKLSRRLSVLFKENRLPTMGEIFRQATVDHIREDHPQVPTQIYNFLGDPATPYNVVSDPRIVSFLVTGETMQIQWTGGRPPFQLQKKENLDAPWVAVGDAVGSFDASVPLSEAAAFFRVTCDQ